MTEVNHSDRNAASEEVSQHDLADFDKTDTRCYSGPKHSANTKLVLDEVYTLFTENSRVELDLLNIQDELKQLVDREDDLKRRRKAIAKRLDQIKTEAGNQPVHRSDEKRPSNLRGI